MSQLAVLADTLEMHVATGRLLAHLFPELNGAEGAPGRFRLIQQALHGRAALLSALKTESSASIQREWKSMLAAHAADVRFLHGLAVLFREQALVGIAAGRPNETACACSAGLWALLLGSLEFWAYFREQRWFHPQSGERQRLPQEHQERLLVEALDTLLTVHAIQASRAYAADNLVDVRIHLRCLDLCRRGRDDITPVLSSQGVRCNLREDPPRAADIRQRAADRLDNWCHVLVNEAEKASTDAERIKRLPQGIRSDYEAGIQHLQPFLELKIPVKRVLRASLAWFNDWCYDLYVNKDTERIKQLMVPAREVAGALGPLCELRQHHTAENQALSMHFLLRGFSTDDAEASVKEYEQALEWNAANENARRLLGDAAEAVLMRSVERAIQCLDRGDCQQAYEELDAVAGRVENKQRVRSARAAVCFRHAGSLANEMHFSEALKKGREALVLEPGEKAIADFVQQMEELAPEEPNIRQLRRAEEALSKDHYDEAIRSTSQIGPSSTFHDRAQHLASAAHFHRALAAANKDDLARAEADLRASLDLNHVPDERKTISSQLDVVCQARAGQALQRAFDANNFDEAERLLRELLSRERGRKEQKTLRSNLSQVLNAKAAKLANNAHSKLEPFGDAITDIMGRARMLQTAMGPDSMHSMQHLFSSVGGACPVCGSDEARTRIATRVLSIVQSTGSFSVSSIGQFWHTYRSDLCATCRMALEAADGWQPEARRLLQEALQLDPTNQAAKKNLDAAT